MTLKARWPASGREHNCQEDIIQRNSEGYLASASPALSIVERTQGISWKSEKGMVVSFEGQDSVAPMKDRWMQGTGDKSKFGLIQIGLSPNARTESLHNNIVSGVVTVGIGGNRWPKGNNESGMSCAAASVLATVKFDNKVVVDKGKLVL